MFFEKNNGFGYAPKILVAPLDWGLGHATRCIPLISNLLTNGATVFIAADGPVKELLQKEFPEIRFLSLKGYNIKYNRHAGWLPFKLLLQAPKLAWCVWYEHKWLKRNIKEHGFDAVISDNRLGLYTKAMPCIYITHQLAIKTANHFTDRLAQKIHYRFINKYTECWVPDNEADNIIAGELSHPQKAPSVPLKYLGILSRFEKKESEKKIDVLVLLSGPEPQRTIFETALLKQLSSITKPVVFVRGLPNCKELLQTGNKNIEVHNHLESAALNTAILQSNTIICRSGYTTIMDLITLQQKAILVATPEQTEQEYLSSFLFEKNVFYSTPQEGFSLTESLEKAARFPYKFILTGNNTYKNILASFLQKLNR